MIYVFTIFFSIFFSSSVRAAIPSQSSSVGEDTKPPLLKYLDPNQIFQTLQGNLNLPSTTDSKGNLDQKWVKEEILPKAKELNKEIREEIGVDLSKFFSWWVKILRAFSQFMINFFEVLSKVLKSD